MSQILPALLPLVFALAATDEFPTAAGPVRITPIEHASLMLEAAGRVVYVDPAQGKYEGRPQADLILVTHTHPDHLAPAVLAKLRKPETTVIAPEAAAKTVQGATAMRNGERRRWKDWSLEAVPMYNLRRGPAPGRVYHEKGGGNGYILTVGGKRFYFAGDTENIPEMRALVNIDVAFIPMNLPYTMTPEEAVEAVRAFKPKVVYPYHYRGANLETFRKALAGTGIEVRIRNWYGD